MIVLNTSQCYLHLWVRSRVVEGIPITLLWQVRTGRRPLKSSTFKPTTTQCLRPVMGSLWRIVAPAADVAPTTIAQDVVDLVLCEAGRVCSVDSKLGRLQGKVGQVASMSATCACLFLMYTAE